MVEKLEFQADISELMNLIIHAFYSNRDVFLREVISNASDALDKQRHADLLASKTNEIYRIRVSASPDAKQLLLEDTGVGMSKEDLVNNLSTIARSGTKQFIQSLQEKSEQIGQFGVGFYSVFLVADNVEVYTQKQDGTVYKWSSDAQQFYTLEEAPDTSFEQGHGTRIVLTLKEDAYEYLEEARLKGIITTHSSFITYPVELFTSKEIEVEVPAEDIVEEIEEEDEDNGTKVEEVEVDEETKAETKVEEKKPKTEKKTVQEWTVVNGDKPVWSLAPADVQEAEYEALYKTLSKDYDGPLYHKHFRTEGAFEFRGILFIPKRAPFDMLGERQREKRRIRLYVKNVLVLDELEKEMLPDWMNFVVGVIDSPDLPLNVSREMLQETKVLKAMKGQLKKQILNMLTTLLDNEPEKYTTFYDAFQKNIKLGVHDGDESLLRFLKVPCTNNDDKPISFDDYVKAESKASEETETPTRETTSESVEASAEASASSEEGTTTSSEASKPSPKPIYYATSADAENAVFTKLYTSKGYRVLLFKEPLDEFMLQRVTKFGEHELINISKEHVVPWSDGTEEKREEFCAWVKETVADGGLEKVRISTSLTTERDAACYVVASKFGWTGNMEKIMMSQPLTDPKTMSWMKGKKIWELNANHPLVRKYQRLFEEKAEASIIGPELCVLYRAALLSAGYPLDNPSEFVNGVVECLTPSSKPPIKAEAQSQTQTPNTIPVESVDNTPVETVEAS
jgi:molecular chaperone HtpG